MTCRPCRSSLAWATTAESSGDRRCERRGVETSSSRKDRGCAWPKAALMLQTRKIRTAAHLRQSAEPAVRFRPRCFVSCFISLSPQSGNSSRGICRHGFECRCGSNRRFKVNIIKIKYLDRSLSGWERGHSVPEKDGTIRKLGVNYMTGGCLCSSVPAQDNLSGRTLIVG